MRKLLIAVALSAGLAGAASAQKPVTVEFTDAEGQLFGTATLTQGSAGVAIALDLKNLDPGPHAIHFHETAKCEGWTLGAAGGHFNPADKKHGLKNPAGPHAGDANNFTADANGNAKATVTAPGMTLGDGPNSVFANGGTALIVHDHGDDMTSDPEGGSGERVACAKITK